MESETEHILVSCSYVFSENCLYVYFDCFYWASCLFVVVDLKLFLIYFRYVGLANFGYWKYLLSTHHFFITYV